MFWLYSVKCQNSSISNNSVSDTKTVLIQTIDFRISIEFSSIWPVDRTLSGATILGQNEPGSDCNEGVLRIPRSYSVTGTSPSDCLLSNPGESSWGSYPSAENHLVYNTAPLDWAIFGKRYKSLSSPSS